MLSLVMHHTGELFIKTPEQEHPLNLIVELKSGPEPDQFALSALEAELEHAVLWFFDLRFDELVDFDYAPEDSKYALNLVRVEILTNITRMIKHNIIDSLADKNITGFEIKSLTV